MWRLLWESPEAHSWEEVGGGKEGCSAGRDGVALTRRKEAAGCGLGWVIFVALYKAELSSI